MKRIWILFFLFAIPLTAHEVLYETGRQQVYAITVTYSDGSPFAYESYQIFSPDSSIPFQTGNCDARGRIFFQPDKQGIWIIRAFSEDGHGITTKIEVNATRTLEDKATYHPALKMISGIAGIVLIFIIIYIYSIKFKKVKDHEK